MSMSSKDNAEIQKLYESIYIEMTSGEVVGPIAPTITDMGQPNADTYAPGDTRIVKGGKNKKKKKPTVQRRNFGYEDTLLYQSDNVKNLNKNISNKSKKSSI
jgi:hypothetical protein